MIVGIVCRLFTVFIIALACFYLSVLERDAVGFSQQFAEDQERLLCGHFLAFEANAHAALSYATRISRLDGAEEAVGDWIEDARPSLACDAFPLSLYKQVNEDLPRDYPNFWFRS